MKYLALALAVCLLCAPIALAEETSGPTYTGNGHFGEHIADFLNEQDCVTHSHQYNDEVYDPDWAVGPGVDLIVWENEAYKEKQENKLAPDKVTVEVKYDINNENGSSYVVASYNLWERLSKKEE